MSSLFLRGLGVVALALAAGSITACTTFKAVERQQQREEVYNSLQGRLEWLASHAPLDAGVAPDAPYRDLLRGLRELRCLDQVLTSPACPVTSN